MKGNQAFSLTKKYKVILSSLLVTGGVGAPLINGAQIPEAEISERIIVTSTVNFFTYLYEYITEKKIINVPLLNNYQLLPIEWTESAATKEYNIWFQ